MGHEDGHATGETTGTEIRLYIGKKYSGVSVCEDAKWPGMWRVRPADGELTDMVNLRAQVAVFCVWPRGLPEGLRLSAGDDSSCHWGGHFVQAFAAAMS